MMSGVIEGKNLFFTSIINSLLTLITKSISIRGALLRNGKNPLSSTSNIPTSSRTTLVSLKERSFSFALEKVELFIYHLFQASLKTG